VEFIYLAQAREKWQAAVTTVMKFLDWLSNNFLLKRDFAAYREICSEPAMIFLVKTPFSLIISDLLFGRKCSS
jgi:hypothetical protein